MKVSMDDIIGLARRLETIRPFPGEEVFVEFWPDRMEVCAYDREVGYRIGSFGSRPYGMGKA